MRCKIGVSSEFESHVHLVPPIVVRCHVLNELHPLNKHDFRRLVGDSLCRRRSATRHKRYTRYDLLLVSDIGPPIWLLTIIPLLIVLTVSMSIRDNKFHASKDYAKVIDDRCILSIFAGLESRLARCSPHRSCLITDTAVYFLRLWSAFAISCVPPPIDTEFRQCTVLYRSNEAGLPEISKRDDEVSCVFFDLRGFLSPKYSLLTSES